MDNDYIFWKFSASRLLSWGFCSGVGPYMWSRAEIFVFNLCAKAWARQVSLTIFKIAWTQMWRKIRFLLVIITLRFTCGERKKCKIFQMLYSGLKFLATCFRKVCLYMLLISLVIVYDSMKEKLTSF